MKSVKLNSGTEMPEIGFGLWKITDPKRARTAVTEALQAGYRHFDTAQAYGNEAYLGEVVAASDIPRSDLFITTKIFNSNQPEAKLLPSFEESLKNLRTDYVDLLLLHFPVTATRARAWEILEQDVYKTGRAKAIGVSNYTVRHLEELLADCTVKPAVNQVELHVFLQQPELLDYCREHDIVVQAYSPLAHGEGLDNAVIAGIAAKHHKTPAQVMIRWCLEAGTVPLPKSETPERIKQNLDVYDFEFDAADMARLDELDSGLRTCWDPTDTE